MFLSISALFPGVHPEVLLEYCQKMIEKFNYPWEMMPLLYVILKYAKGDIDEASKHLFEGSIFQPTFIIFIKENILLQLFFRMPSISSYIINLLL